MALRRFQYSITTTWMAGALAFAMVSCGEDRPKDILSHQEMVGVLTEIYVAEQKTGQLALGHDSATQVFKIMEGKVFEQAKVPDSVFRKSFDFYIERPKELEEIYAVLVDSLNLKEQRIDGKSASPVDNK